MSSPMMTALVADRLDLLVEIESIGEALAVVEQRYGPHAEIEALRQRQHRARGIVLAQLRACLWEPETVH
jgi:hypothetical protein